MSETGISRRGAFASLLGGWATLWFWSRASSSAPVACVQCATDCPTEGVTLYTYAEKGRLLSLVTRHHGEAATAAF